MAPCTACKLHAGRTQTVFGVGDPDAGVVFVGEAPGRDEDRLGEPFVGRAGQLLDRMFAAIGMTRTDPDPGRALYITNVLPWRPPSNRTPDAGEIAMMLPFLERHIALADPQIVRNRLKVIAAVTNARAWLDLKEQHADMDAWLWQFVHGEPVCNSWTTPDEVPANTPASDAMSKALKKAGFKFVGTTICYAFMQATGMVNDHTTDCFRWAELAC